MTNNIDKQYSYFTSILSSLIDKGLDGKYALIHAEKFIGSYDSEQSAYEEGVRLFGTETFLVQKITQEAHPETVQLFRYVHLQ